MEELLLLLNYFQVKLQCKQGCELHNYDLDKLPCNSILRLLVRQERHQ